MPVTSLSVNWYTFRGANSAIFIFATQLSADQLIKTKFCSIRLVESNINSVLVPNA